MSTWANNRKMDEYLETLSKLILESNYTTKEEIHNLLSAHFGIMMMESEKPINADLQIQYDKKREYLLTLQRIGSPKINIVQNELLALKSKLKESNRIIYNGDQMNLYAELKEFVKSKFGASILTEFYGLKGHNTKSK